MKILNAIVASCFFALGFAAMAGAQGGPGGPMGGMMMGGGPQPRGIFNPIVGSGAQYEFDSPGKGGKMTMEIDVVGKESSGGKDGFWLETTMSGTPMGDMIMKMLLVSDGASATVEKMIMQAATSPPMDMTPQMGRAAGQTKQNVDIRNNAEKVGSESVTTPAGTFTADHYRMKDSSGDFWLSDKISPYGLIKGQGKEFNMVLTKVITDAKDKITGTVVPFNPMLLVPGGAGGPPRK